MLLPQANSAKNLKIFLLTLLSKFAIIHTYTKECELRVHRLTQKIPMRIEKKVRILATPQVIDLAETALSIQDAVNSRAILNTLTKAMDFFRNSTGQYCQSCFADNGSNSEFTIPITGTDIGLQNPVVLAILNKLNDLARMQQSRDECFLQCYDLANGKNVDCTVWFLQ